MMFLRAPYNYDTNAASDESSLSCEDVSLTQQNQKEESDINTIVRRFGLTGELPSDVRMPQYGDFTGITDYRSALHAVKDADDAFMTMPAEVRNRFNNDPEKFVEFCLDPANLDEAKKLGLVVENAPATTVEVSSTESAANKVTPKSDGKVTTAP